MQVTIFFLNETRDSMALVLSAIPSIGEIMFIQHDGEKDSCTYVVKQRSLYVNGKASEYTINVKRL